jgi:hypothetical protein
MPTRRKKDQRRAEDGSRGTLLPDARPPPVIRPEWTEEHLNATSGMGGTALVSERLRDPAIDRVLASEIHQAWLAQPEPRPPYPLAAPAPAAAPVAALVETPREASEEASKKARRKPLVTIDDFKYKLNELSD